MPSEDSQLSQALALAKSGKLEQAQALLLTIEHPKADALLEKVNKAIAARGGSNQAPKAKTRKGLDFVGLLIALGIFIASVAISGFLGNMLYNAGGQDPTTVNILAFILFVLLMVFGIALARRLRG